MRYPPSINVFSEINAYLPFGSDSTCGYVWFAFHCLKQDVCTLNKQGLWIIISIISSHLRIGSTTSTHSDTSTTCSARSRFTTPLRSPAKWRVVFMDADWLWFLYLWRSVQAPWFCFLQDSVGSHQLSEMHGWCILHVVVFVLHMKPFSSLSDLMCAMCVWFVWDRDDAGCWPWAWDINVINACTFEAEALSSWGRHISCILPTHKSWRLRCGKLRIVRDEFRETNLKKWSTYLPQCQVTPIQPPLRFTGCKQTYRHSQTRFALFSHWLRVSCDYSTASLL